MYNEWAEFIYTPISKLFRWTVPVSGCSCIDCRVCVDLTHDHSYCKRQRLETATGLDSAGIQLTNENDFIDIQSTSESNDADEASQFSVGNLQSTSDEKLRFAQSKIRRLQREVKLYN